MPTTRCSTVAILLLAATGCGGPAPSAPTSVPQTTQTTTSIPSAPQTFPQVVATLVGGNGPTDCSTGPRLGTTSTFPLGVYSAWPNSFFAQPEPGPVIQLVLDPRSFPTDHSGDYEGTVRATGIRASGHYYGGELCGGNTFVGMVDYGVPATFTGSLSADGGLLTGREIRTAMLGQTVYTYEYDWRAVLK